MTYIKKVTALNLDSICLLVIFIYFTVANFFPNNIYYQIITTIFILSLGLYIITKGGMSFCSYFVSNLMFILYSYALVFLGVCISPNASLSLLKTISYTFIINFMLFNFIVYYGNLEKILKVYLWSSVVSLSSIMFICRKELINGRLAMAFGQNEKSYVLFGIDVLVSPNAIAFFCSLSVFLSLLYIIKEKKFKYFFVMCFLVIGLMLTGSRKGLLLLVAGVIFILFTIYTKQRFESLLLSLLALGIVYLLTMNIPFLYNIIGERTQALIVSIFSDGPVSEASIQTRKLLRQEAFSYFKRRPMLGYGIDTFRQMNKWHIITDNNYLELLVSGGIVGLIIYYSWLPSALINNYRLKEKTAYYKILFFVMIFMFVLEYGQVTFLSRGSTLIYPFVFSYFSLCNKKYSKYGWRKKDDF